MKRIRRIRGGSGVTAVGLAALGVTALLATSLTAALGGFTATVVNPNTNGVATGTLMLSEGNGVTTCLSTGTTISTNSSTCTTIDNFGSLTNAKVGDTSSVTLTMENSGSIAASSLTLTPGACTAVGNLLTAPYAGTDTAGFCGVVDVTIQQVGATTACVYPASTSAPCPSTPTSAGTLAGLGGTSPFTLPGLAAGATVQYTVTVLIDSAATNADQGLAATVPLTWELAQ
ncbi:MAG: hypothetical protein ACYDGN_05165 [Acidimicrobiales bacterium]